MASRKAHSVTYSVIDTETTGLSAEKNRIIEIAVVTVREFRIVDQFVTTIALPEGTSIGAEHIHGISREMLADAPSFGDVAATLLARLAGTTLVAHNAPFDVKFLIAEMARVGLEWPSPPVMCTLEGARHRMPGESSYKLGSLAKKCGISLDNAHSALDDTVACAELFIRLMKDTPDLLVDDPMAVSWPWVSPENAHPGSARPAPALV